MKEDFSFEGSDNDVQEIERDFDQNKLALLHVVLLLAYLNSRISII